MSDNPPLNERDANKYSIPELFQLIKKYNVEPPRTTTKKKLVKCYVDNVVPLLINKRIVQDSNKKKRNASEIEENITIKKTRVQNVEDDSEDDESDSYEDLDNNNMDDDNNNNENNNSNNISDENVNKFVSPKNFSFENTITPINANKNSGNKSSNNNNNNNSNNSFEDRHSQKEIQKSQNNSNNNMAPKETVNKNVSSNSFTSQSSQQTQFSQLSQQTQLSQPVTKSQTHSPKSQSQSQQIHRIQSNEYQKQQQNRFNEDDDPKINYSSSSSYSQGHSVLSQFNVEPVHRKGNLPTPPKGLNPNIIKTTNTKRVVYEESDSSVDEGNRVRKTTDSEAKILLYVFGPILLIFLFIFFFPEIKYNALLVSSSDPDYRAYLHSKYYIESNFGQWLCRETENQQGLVDGVLRVVKNVHKISFNDKKVIQLLRQDPSLNFNGQEVSFNHQTGTELLPYVCRLKYYGFNYGVYLAVTFFTLFVVFSYIA